jgi:hypothetical protein
LGSVLCRSFWCALVVAAALAIGGCDSGGGGGRDVVMKNVHAVLKHKGKEYSGTYHGSFGITCGGTHSSSAVDVSFKVMKARALAGEWRATKLEGTVENSEVFQFGCVSGTVSIKGSLRGRG